VKEYFMKILAQMKQAAEESQQATNAYLEGLKSLGIDLSDNASGGSLSGSIASITEDTADLLASYINAIRADVSYIRANGEVLYEGMKEYYELVAPRLNVIADSQLTELRNISAYTLRNAVAAETISDTLSQVTNGIKTLKVS